MNTAELLADAFGRVQEAVHEAVQGLSADESAEMVEPGSNTVAWLVWHLSRIQDDHVADVAGTEQVWTAEGWQKRFGLLFRPAATGYGHRPEQVAKVRVEDTALLTGYYDAVHERTVAFVRGLSGAQLDRVVDERWDPPVTLGVRLVSVISDDLQHAGQASFVRGVLLRRR
jgi:uncharacterized damage-inducible protein DinB